MLLVRAALALIDATYKAVEWHRHDLQIQASAMELRLRNALHFFNHPDILPVGLSALRRVLELVVGVRQVVRP
jgi:hypothetical protein